ncbi:MAG: DUF475 domain-containing protein [Burkholderiales bacterium]|nr:DUF475 domain-containing protein [Burkholderiales bacterium]
MLRFFLAPLVFSLVALVCGLLIGGGQAAWIVLALAGLESALSFDNAVVNARLLAQMDAVWRRRFLVWGMFVAVFLMRLVFPILLVAIASGIGPVATVRIAIESPHLYAALLMGAHDQIAGFGGAFLLLVFLRFFTDSEKQTHWLARIELLLARLGKLNAVEIALTLIAVLLVASWLPSGRAASFVLAGVWGVVSFVLVDGLSGLLGEGGGVEATARNGLAGFLYLEALDASFSFDGVIGAFALSHNLLLIALGLGAGAMFVRGFTLMMVEQGTLNRYRYLEHGAFWAIGALAAIMLLGVKVEVPEVLTGGIGLVLIGLSWWTSLRRLQLEAAQSD